MQQRSPVPRRASRTQEQANPHHVGFYAGTHPEDQPYQSDDFAGGDASCYDPPRLPNSAVRYNRPDPQGQQIIRQGNRQLVIHYDEPPSKYRKRRRFHWLFWVGVLLFLAIAGTWVANNVGVWWLNQQNTWTYGMPRTYQIDAVVGHGDSTLHPSHFIALNLGGTIEVIEIPAGNPRREKVYIGPIIFSPTPEFVPVTVSFQDVNGDGKPDMLLHIQGQIIIFLNGNGQFQSPKQ